MIIGVAGEAGSGKNEVGKILERELGYVQIALADPIKRYVKDIFDFDDEKLWGSSAKRAEGDGRYPVTPEARDFVSRVERSVRGYDEKAMVQAFREVTGLNPDEHFLSARKPCQLLGTEGVRAAWDSAWVDKAIRVARELVTAGSRDYSPKKGVYECMFPQRDDPFPGVVITDVRFRNEVTGIRAAGGFVVRVTRPGAGLSGTAASHQSEQELATMADGDFDAVVRNDATLGALRDRVMEALESFE